MSAPQQPIDLGTLPTEPGPETVIEIGSRRRFEPRGWSRGLLSDHRLVPVLASVAGVAAFGSLVAEWQTTTIDPSALDIEQPTAHAFAADLVDLGALAGGYVVGVLALTTALVLILFGPAAIRRSVRLGGLGVAAATFAVVAGLGASLDRQSRAIPSLFTLQWTDRQMQLSYGRGLWCAAVAVLLAGAALLLAGRATAAPPVLPRQTAADDDPLEMTVSPASAFPASSPPASAFPASSPPASSFPADSGREGISG